MSKALKHVMMHSELSKGAQTRTQFCQKTGYWGAVYSGTERSGQAVWAQQGSWVMGRNPSWDEVILKPKETSLMCSVGFKAGSQCLLLQNKRVYIKTQRMAGVQGGEREGEHVLPNHPSPYLVLSQLHIYMNSFPLK